jgi:hypothetical protein
MPFTSREAIFSALFNLLKAIPAPAILGSNGAWVYSSRDLEDFVDFDPANQPALFMPQDPRQEATMEVFALSQWKLRATAWIYYQADDLIDPSAPRDAVANAVVDAFNAGLVPQPGIPQTLGGLVLNTYIDGTVFSVSGALPEPQRTQAIITIPISMLIGEFGA